MNQVPSRVEELVADEFQCSILSCEMPTSGRIGETYLLELDDNPGRVVCKMGGPSVRTGDVIEPLAVQLVEARTDVPVPEVYASGTLDGETGYRKHWALYEFMDGEVPSPFDSLDPAVRQRIVSESGEILGTLHATQPFNQIGGLYRRDDELCVDDPHGLNFPKQGRRVARIHPQFRDHEWEPVLSHGDFFPDNLLIDRDGSITAVLDWGNAQLTTSGYALARAEMRFIDWFSFPSQEETRLREALRDGYQQYRPLPPDYPELKRLYKGMWLAQSADRVFRHLLSSRGRQQMKRHLHSLLP